MLTQVKKKKKLSQNADSSNITSDASWIKRLTQVRCDHFLVLIFHKLSASSCDNSFDNPSSYRIKTIYHTLMYPPEISNVLS